jgi:hypothetical protein
MLNLPPRDGANLMAVLKNVPFFVWQFAPLIQKRPPCDVALFLLMQRALLRFQPYYQFIGGTGRQQIIGMLLKELVAGNAYSSQHIGTPQGR